MKRMRTPRVIQMEAAECGAASLSILLKYYGLHVPLEVLREDCGVSRSGVNALNIILAARKYGLEGKGYSKTIERLAQLESPAILFWEYRHFLVLEGFGQNSVYLNDPATGPRSVSLQEFSESYSGICLEFEKTASFQKSGRPESFPRQIVSRFKSVPFALLFLLLTSFCLLFAGLAMPAFLMIFIDTFLQKGLLPWPSRFLGAVLLTALFTGALFWLRQYVLNRLNSKLSIRFSCDFFWHLLRLPLQFYYQRYYGEIAYRMFLNNSVVEALTESLLTTSIDLLLIVFYGIVLFAYDIPIALVSVFFALLNLGVMSWIYRSRSNAYACLQQEVGKNIGISINGLDSIESIKLNASESDFFAKWSGSYTRTLNARQQLGKKDVILATVPLFFQLAATAALLGLGSFRILEGSMSVGMLMALQLLQINFLLPINRFVSCAALIQNTQIDLDRLNDVMKNPTAPCYRTTASSHPGKLRLEGSLEFRNVSFGYAPLEPPLLDNISFLIQPGQRVAIVGPTGSGKSTVAKLASGLFHPRGGQILYDGIPIEELPRELLCNSMSTVDQEIFLFAGTIRENLVLWDRKVPEEMLIAVARDACIHEEIIARPGGYESPLIEGGRNLSGGQRQRLEIARALLYNPSLLILDEATSALDSKTEQQISEKLKQRGCSALMIAHRLSTIQDCDEILVLDRGKIAQRGSHETLKEQEGIYREMVRAEALDV